MTSLLLFFFLLQSEVKSDPYIPVYVAIASVAGAIAGTIITQVFNRPKTQAEIHSTFATIQRENAKQLADMQQKIVEANERADEKIAEARRDRDEKVAASTAKVIEIAEKLDEWIKRVEKRADEKLLDDEEMRDVRISLEECLETKDVACKKCTQKFLVFLNKIEITIAVDPNNQWLLLELNELRKELNGE